VLVSLKRSFNSALVSSVPKELLALTVTERVCAMIKKTNASLARDKRSLKKIELSKFPLNKVAPTTITFNLLETVTKS
jgi:hypothetical protein